MRLIISLLLMTARIIFCGQLCAGPVTILNSTAEPVKKNTWIYETHYGYYYNTYAKNATYWGYARGNGDMDRMGDYDMRYVTHALTPELYYTFIDRILGGILVPTFIKDVKKQDYAGGQEVPSNGFGDMALRADGNRKRYRRLLHKADNPVFDLVPDLPEKRELLRLVPSACGRILETPMNPLIPPRKPRARLFRVIANGDHIIKLLSYKFSYGLGRVF